MKLKNKFFNTTLFKTIKQQVDKLDVYSLLESGCPKDEFNNETYLIFTQLQNGMQAYEIAEIMAKVFTESFNENYDVNNFINSAIEIEKELNK